MRHSTNLIKSSLLTLALATVSLAAFTGHARAADGTTSAEAPINKYPASSEDPVPMPLPRPGPPAADPDPMVRADLNHDGSHNMDDLILLLMSWGSCPATDAICSGDINLDGAVNDFDLMQLLRLINAESGQ